MKEDVEQVYCTGCSKYLSDRFVEGTCPNCGYTDARGDQCDSCGKLLNAADLVSPRCKVHREHVVETRTSTHLFLNLPELEPRLREWIEKSSTEGRWTANARSITRGWLADGLRPRCITRDLSWGTPVPVEEFKDKVFYVWFDAPIGYISMTACYTPEWRRWWQNPDRVKLYQFMGKDNIPFHTVIFPASLIGTEKPWTLLHHVSTTEFLNYEGGKFSKSRNVGVFGDTARETGVPSEVWRYYLLAVRPENADSVFNWDDFMDKNNNELLANVGNFVNRALSLSYTSFDGRLVQPKTPPGDAEVALAARVTERLAEYNELMEQVKIRPALLKAMAISAEGNTFFQQTAPWTLKKEGKLDEFTSIVAHAVALTRIVAAVLEPFMPGLTDKINFLMNLDHTDIPSEFSLCFPDGHAIKKPQPIFSTILPEQIAEWRARFGGGSAESTATSALEAAASAGHARGKGKAAGGGGGGGGGAKGKGGGGGAAAAPAAPQTDYSKVSLKVGVITKVWHHPESDKLFCEEVRIEIGGRRRGGNGEEGRRISCAIALSLPLRSTLIGSLTLHHSPRCAEILTDRRGRGRAAPRGVRPPEALHGRAAGRAPRGGGHEPEAEADGRVRLPRNGPLRQRRVRRRRVRGPARRRPHRRPPRRRGLHGRRAGGADQPDEEEQRVGHHPAGPQDQQRRRRLLQGRPPLRRRRTLPSPLRRRLSTQLSKVERGEEWGLKRRGRSGEERLNVPVDWLGGGRKRKEEE